MTGAENRVWDPIFTLPVEQALEAAGFLDMHFPNSPVVTFLRDYANQCAMRTVFELVGPGCCVDGKPIHSKSRGLPLAWLVLVADRLHLGELRVDWFFDGKRPAASAVQALSRAADDAERYSRPLAAAIRAIGTRGGCFVVKRPVLGIVCTSPRLVRAVA